MTFLGDPRRRSIAVFGLGVVLLIALLGTLQAFNIRILNPETPGETIMFTGLVVVVFLLLMVLLMLLLRNIVKLYADQSSSALGARLRTRMVLGATVIALTPAAFMFLFSFLLMNRSIDRWFSQPTTELREDSTRVVIELAQYVTSNARGEAESIAATGAADGNQQMLQSVLTSHRVTLDGGFVVIFNRDRKQVANYEAPPPAADASVIAWEDAADHPDLAIHGQLQSILLAAARRSDLPVLKVAEQEYALGVSPTPNGNLVVAALPLPQGLSQTTARIRSGAQSYWALFRARNSIRTIFFMLQLLITVFIFFSSLWLAMFLSKQITRPVEALGLAMDEIAAGKYDHRVSTIATGEMGDLVRAFNHMAADLDASRQLVESSAAQLTAANQALEARRRELETILETIPSGVVTLDGAGTVLQSNRAFTSLMGLGENLSLAGEKFQSLLPQELADDVAGLMRRGQRMGAASAEIDFRSKGHTAHLAITSARLELTGKQTGSVIVVEDTSELLRAQRQMAWKEVAQRVAHEIKNPLTPIALSAERIGRHLDRAQPDSPSVIRKCSEVILSCVGSLRSLVDQFSALAQFPAPQPRACDMNKVIEEALAMFAGRLEGITVQRNLEAGLPTVLADSEALRRALANLIDNAAEAMQGSLLRVLNIHSSMSEDGAAVEVTVSDTGHGLTDEIRERLFLPFYSTKHRGTGLGLSIAAKIVQEHGGSIRAESNTPKGARFVLRMPLMEPAMLEGAAESAAKGQPS